MALAAVAAVDLRSFFWSCRALGIGSPLPPPPSTTPSPGPAPAASSLPSLPAFSLPSDPPSAAAPALAAFAARCASCCARRSALLIFGFSSFLSPVCPCDAIDARCAALRASLAALAAALAASAASLSSTAGGGAGAGAAWTGGGASAAAGRTEGEASGCFVTEGEASGCFVGVLALGLGVEKLPMRMLCMISGICVGGGSGRRGGGVSESARWVTERAAIAGSVCWDVFERVFARRRGRSVGSGCEAGGGRAPRECRQRIARRRTRASSRRDGSRRSAG